MKKSPAQPLRQAARWLAVAVLTVAGASVAAPAHAADSTTCTGTTQLSYTPGLTLTPQTVTVSETDSVPTCISTDPSITSVITSPYSFPVPNASCNNVQLDPGNVLVIHWNNGQSSTVSGLTYVTTVTAGITQTTGTGTVTAGRFTGAVGVLTWVYALVNPLLCLTPGGLTGQNGTILAQIIG
ncbi:hypothetical protein ABT185_36650 [Streptomyces clavifer]|uniref:hypothetical protein n=1 Tax=Streptomyces clavifer TaxID=68188 RepID=UPI00332D3B15